jgi:hypothetical protein
VALGFFFQEVVIISMKSLNHCPVSNMLVSYHYKGEKKRQRKTKEDLGGLCDRCGQEKRKDFSRYEETGWRQNCFQAMNRGPDAARQ